MLLPAILLGLEPSQHVIISLSPLMFVALFLRAGYLEKEQSFFIIFYSLCSCINRGAFREIVIINQAIQQGHKHTDVIWEFLHHPYRFECSFINTYKSCLLGVLRGEGIFLHHKI